MWRGRHLQADESGVSGVVREKIVRITNLKDSDITYNDNSEITIN